jgi:prevent-host-death family protein
MPVTLKSSEVQQNFGLVMDRVLREDDVIVERYGTPKVVIVDYQRYQALRTAEQALLRARLEQASVAAAARAQDLTEEEITALIEEAREAAHREGAGS